MVQLDNIHKDFGEVKAVDGVSLSINPGEMVSLLGPSGCGKTTLLRVLSGFLKPSEGSVVMDGKDVTLLPPDKRPTSLVFQNYALFPHMTVFENVAFGLRVKKQPLSRIKESVAEMLALVGLSGMEQRAIRQLSGGQQQRVALARALVMKPAVLLLDEPLSNLDAKLRVETRIQIRKIQQSVGITSIFVTHDQEEALTISDRIAIMNKGRIIQFGSPEEVYHRPNSNFVADFVGKSNFLSGRYEPQGEGEGIFTLSDGQRIPVRGSAAPAGADRLMIRPERMSLSDGTPGSAVGVPGVCGVTGTVEYVTFLGEVVYYHLILASGETMMVPIYGKDIRGAGSAAGKHFFIRWEPEAGLVLAG
jgi:spermidine/putrescine ABC transporter ATP-binding subunit